MNHQANKKLDTRTLKTVDSIYEAFLSLLEHKNFRIITVKMICESARISRSTFYDHFEDKFQLLSAVLRDITEDTARDFVYFSGSTPAALPMLTLRSKYRKLFQEIFFNPENHELYERYYQIVNLDIRNKICQKQNLDTSSDISWLTVITEFYTAAIISVNKLWCSDKLNLADEEMAQYIHVLLDPLHEHGDKLREISNLTIL